LRLFRFHCFSKSKQMQESPGLNFSLHSLQFCVHAGNELQNNSKFLYVDSVSIYMI
jgi:hypothetical protein